MEKEKVQNKNKEVISPSGQQPSGLPFAADGTKEGHQNICQPMVQGISVSHAGQQVSEQSGVPGGQVMV